MFKPDLEKIESRLQNYVMAENAYAPSKYNTDAMRKKQRKTLLNDAKKLINCFIKSNDINEATRLHQLITKIMEAV